MDRRILLVEDEYLIGIALQNALESAGYEVVGPAASVQEALALLSGSRVDIAILDCNLRGQSCNPIADYLSQRGIPFLLVTGYASGGFNEAFPDVPVLPKPVNLQTLLSTIDRMLEQSKH